MSNTLEPKKRNHSCHLPICEGHLDDPWKLRHPKNIYSDYTQNKPVLLVLPITAAFLPCNPSIVIA